MGEVYLAHDERLQRDVAVKVLPAESLPDDAARRHFRHEALAISRLNHPNIATVYDFDTFDGVDALVMEYVPGSTLASLIAAGPLPVPRALDLATQLARGLDAAHRQNVVHRDLKPNNVRITEDGLLKILDFGLARFVRAGSMRTREEPLSASEATGGTPSYMSPEQIRGEPEGPASDLFSLGLILYELFTGRHAFEASHQAAVIYRIGHDEPAPPSSLRAGLPPGVDALVKRLLSKSAGDRGSTAGAVADALRAMSQPAAEAHPRHRARRFVWRAAGVAGVLLLGWMLAYILRPNEVYSSRTEDGAIRQATFTGDATVPCWSPDGKHIAYVRGEGGHGRVYVMPADGGPSRRLDSSYASLIAWGWTHDSQGVLAHGYAPGTSRVDIVRLDLFGAPERVLIENAVYPALSPDGHTLAFTGFDSAGSAISLMNMESGAVSRVVSSESPENPIYKPQWLPDGKSLSYMRWAGGPGHELWIANQDGSGARQVPTQSIWLGGHYSITRRGNRAIIAGEHQAVWAIWSIDLDGRDHYRLTAGSERDYHVALAPDDRRFVFARSADLTRIGVLDIGAGTIAQPVRMSVSTRHPAFSADGTVLFVQALIQGRWQVWRCGLADAGRLDPLLMGTGASFCSPTISGDDLLHIRSEVGLVNIWGAIRWSQTLWRCAADGGRQQRLSPEGVVVSRIAPGQGPAGVVLYSRTGPESAGEVLLLQNVGGDARELAKDTDAETMIAFDWGFDDGTAILLVEGGSGDREQSVVALDTRDLSRRTILTPARLAADLGLEGRVSLREISRSPDRRSLALLLGHLPAAGEAATLLAVLDAASQRCHLVGRVASPETAANVAWSPDGMRLAFELARSSSDLFIWEPATPAQLAAR